MRLWVRFAAILVCGYGLFGRTFAYVGIPPAKLFIGDIALALFIVFCTGSIIRPWWDGLVSSSGAGRTAFDPVPAAGWMGARTTQES